MALVSIPSSETVTAAMPAWGTHSAIELSMYDGASIRGETGGLERLGDGSDCRAQGTQFRLGAIKSPTSSRSVNGFLPKLRSCAPSQ